MTNKYQNTYVALSMQDYKNHNYIDNKIEYIEDNFPEYAIIVTAIDINDMIKKEDKNKGLRYIEENYFFPVIIGSDVVIGLNNSITNQFTFGAVIEMEYGIFNNKKVYEYDSTGLTELTKDDIGKHYTDVCWTIPGEEPVRIKDRYKDDIDKRWWY